MNTELPASETLFSDKNSQIALGQSRDLQIMFEYETLAHYTPIGIFVVPDFETIHTWHGIVLIRSGPYEGTVHKFSIFIPKDYPLSIPRVSFINYLFHPLVDPISGELNLSPKFPVWRAKKDFIFMILRYIKAIFMQKESWAEKFVKNKAAFECFNNEKLFRQQIRRFSEGKGERPSPGAIHKFEENRKEDEESEKVLKVFKKIQNEENVKEFLEWFNDTFEGFK